MLVNPNVQPTSYTPQPTPVASGVALAQSDLLRSDLRPVEQPAKTAGGQNQLPYSEDLFREKPDRQKSVANSLAASAESVDSGSGLTRVDSSPGEGDDSDSPQASPTSEERIAEQQRQEDAAIVRQLKARDREVRLHEAAHAAVGGRYAGAPKFQFERGPDGVNYAVSGEVSISVSPAATPEETLEKARQIRAAATAPAEPSAQDRAVAAEASRMEAQARSEIQAQAVEESNLRSERAEGRRDDGDDDRRAGELDAERDEDTDDRVSVGVSNNQIVNEITAPESSSVNAVSYSDTEQQERSSGVEGREQDRKTAREQLEEVLLGNRSIPEALNQAGLIDTENPYGKGGLIQYIV